MDLNATRAAGGLDLGLDLTHHHWHFSEDSTVVRWGSEEWRVCRRQHSHRLRMRRTDSVVQRRHEPREPSKPVFVRVDTTVHAAQSANSQASKLFWWVCVAVDPAFCTGYNGIHYGRCASEVHVCNPHWHDVTTAEDAALPLKLPRREWVNVLTDGPYGAADINQGRGSRRNMLAYKLSCQSLAPVRSRYWSSGEGRGGSANVVEYCCLIMQLVRSLDRPFRAPCMFSSLRDDSDPQVSWAGLLAFQLPIRRSSGRAMVRQPPQFTGSNLTVLYVMVGTRYTM